MFAEHGLKLSPVCHNDIPSVIVGCAIPPQFRSLHFERKFCAFFANCNHNGLCRGRPHGLHNPLDSMHWVPRIRQKGLILPHNSVMIEEIKEHIFLIGRDIVRRLLVRIALRV